MEQSPSTEPSPPAPLSASEAPTCRDLSRNRLLRFLQHPLTEGSLTVLIVTGLMLISIWHGRDTNALTGRIQLAAFVVTLAFLLRRGIARIPSLVRNGIADLRTAFRVLHGSLSREAFRADLELLAANAVKRRSVARVDVKTQRSMERALVEIANTSYAADHNPALASVCAEPAVRRSPASSGVTERSAEPTPRGMRPSEVDVFLTKYNGQEI